MKNCKDVVLALRLPKKMKVDLIKTQAVLMKRGAKCSLTKLMTEGLNYVIHKYKDDRKL